MSEQVAEFVLSLSEHDKNVIYPGFKTGDEVTILEILHEAGHIPYPIDQSVVESLLSLSDKELIRKLRKAKLDRKMTRGEAIMQLYRRQICAKQTGLVTFITKQKFVVDRKDISCDSLLGQLAFWGNEIPVDEYNSEQFARLLESLKTKDVLELEAFYNEYLKVIADEVDMRENMYRNNADHKYFESYYNLVTFDDVKFNKLYLLIEEAFQQGLLFSNKKLKRREDSKIYFDLYDRIINEDKRIAIAGGAIFSAIFKNTLQDIDIFLTTKDSKEATNIVRELAKRCRASVIIRTENSVTMLDCFRHNQIKRRGIKIQVILRLYNSLSEVLHGFDVDCSCIGYDYTKTVRLTKRCQYALEKGINTVNFDRLSPTYEIRMVKYAARNMAIYVPNFQPDLVKQDLLNQDYEARNLSKLRMKYGPIEGLSVLLITNERAKHNKGFFSFLGRVLDFSDYTDEIQPSYGMAVEEIAAIEGFDELNVDLRVNLPYVNYTYTGDTKIHDYHWTFVTGSKNELENVLFVPDRVMKLLKALKAFGDLPRDITWKTTKPGEQMTNTFHKIVLENVAEWYNGRYYSDSSSSDNPEALLLEAAKKGDLQSAERAVEQGAKGLDRALKEAAAQNQVEIVAFLIRKGASRTGLTAAAVEAAANGHLELLKELEMIGASLTPAVLRKAATNNQLQVVDYLLRHKHAAYMQVDDALAAAAAKGHIRIIKYIYDTGFATQNVDIEGMLLDIAAEKGQLEVVHYLLEKFNYPSAFLQTVMISAAQNNHKDVVEVLADNGADLSAALSNAEDYQLEKASHVLRSVQGRRDKHRMRSFIELV